MIFILLVYLMTHPVFSFVDADIARYQAEIRDRAVGERIALWAEKFVGVPYDQDPMGEYVSKRVIVADERVDCMYLTFRSVELALSDTPAGALETALDKRFHARGVLENGSVLNYGDRFEYGEDMIDSGKWGREVTGAIGKTRRIEGSRKSRTVSILPAKELKGGLHRLKSGDLVFFIKDPAKRVRDEIVGHIGIVKVEADPGKNPGATAMLIHASGTKRTGGVVKKMPLKDYLEKMPYIGTRITRF